MEKYFLISGEGRKYFRGKIFFEKSDKKTGSAAVASVRDSVQASAAVGWSRQVIGLCHISYCISPYYISFCHSVICYISLYHIMNYYAISSYSLNNSLRTPDYNRLQCRKFCIHVSAFFLHRCIDDDRTLIFKYQYIVAIMTRNTLSHSRSQVLEEFIQGVPEKSIPLKSKRASWPLSKLQIKGVRGTAKSTTYIWIGCKPWPRQRCRLNICSYIG